MGFRFFSRIKILPGITLNLSKSGASVSAGVRGAHVTVGKNGVRKTVGLPCSGIFYTQYEKHGSKPVLNAESAMMNNNQVYDSNNSALILFLLAVIGISAANIFSVSIVWPILIVAAVFYYARKKSAEFEQTAMPDPREGIDKRFFTASGEAKFSEAEAAVIVESAQAMLILVNKSLIIANESTDYDTRVSNTKIAKDAMATLKKYTKLYPGINLTNLEEVKHMIELIEQETQEMLKKS